MDRRRGPRRLPGGTAQARQPTSQHAARHPFAAQCLGLGPVRCRAPTARRPGAGPGAVGALAHVVCQSNRAACNWPAALAACVDGAGAQFVSWAGRHPYRLPSSLWARRLSEARHAFGLLEDDPGIVRGGGAGRLALVHHPRIGPIGDARAAATTFLIAHHVAPLRAVDVAVREGEWIIVAIHDTVVSGA